jgi:transcriptional regulator with XRE-family HTH domain
MKFEIPASWYEAIDKLDEGTQVGAGALAAHPGPVRAVQKAPESHDEGKIAFCQFVTLSRRRRGLSVEELAQAADIDLGELVTIEQHDPHFTPDVRSVYQLANFFSVSRPRLMTLAGLTKPRNDTVVEQALKFAARSVSVEKLSSDERAILEGYVALLSEDAKSEAK